MLARLSEGHILALRLYTTSAFVSLNTPFRELERDARTGEVTRPPRLRRPHPLPVTLAFIHEGLKRIAVVTFARDLKGESVGGLLR